MGLEDPGVVGEQAEDEPHEKAFQIVAAVARCVQRIVQPADDLGRLDVGRVLITEGAALNTDDEAEGLDMLGEIREREGDRFALVEIVELEGLKVADQNVPRLVALGERIEVLPRLIVGLGQIASLALLLDEQDPGPEQIDEAVAVVELRDVRFVARDATSAYAEDVEELVVEALCVSGFVGGIVPFARAPTSWFT